ncbi:uncharacterized protein LOC144141024 isoform X2 [Haemaphysalis longicornis]
MTGPISPQAPAHLLAVMAMLPATKNGACTRNQQRLQHGKNYLLQGKLTIGGFGHTHHRVHGVHMFQLKTPYFDEVAELHETSSLQVEVECSYCQERQRFDNVMKHMESLCPKRPISCVFCKGYIAAYRKPMHEANCNKRPGTCPHCKAGFRTMLELEEKHYPECLQMPVTCTFREMGCEFTSSRLEMVEHEKNGNHADILVKEIACLKREIKALKKGNKGTPRFMIRIVLVNHVNEDRKQEFEFDPATGDAAEECLRKPSVGRPNAMFGFSHLIPISVLEAESSEFVSHNSVVFQFVVLPV